LQYSVGVSVRGAVPNAALNRRSSAVRAIGTARRTSPTLTPSTACCYAGFLVIDNSGFHLNVFFFSLVPERQENGSTSRGIVRNSAVLVASVHAP